MQNNENNIFITGPPRSGKSTLIGDVVDELGLKAEGLRTPEIRKEGKRVGFKLLDVKSGDQGILAHVDLTEGPKVGKYKVNLDDLERFCKISLKDHSDDCDMLIIDEIGTMELFSKKFEDTVKELLDSDVLVLAVLHRHHVDDYGGQGKLFDMDEGEHGCLKEEVKGHIMEAIKKKK